MSPEGDKNAFKKILKIMDPQNQPNLTSGNRMVTTPMNQEILDVTKGNGAEELASELLTSSYLRSEVNFLRYPLFALTTRDLRKIDRIEYREVREEAGEQRSIYWKVSRNIDDTIPGPFDKRVFRAIEEILDDRPLPLPQLVKIGSLYRLCQVMELPDSGKNIHMLKQSLRRISGATIDQDNALYDKSRRRWIPKTEGRFHLFDVFFKNDLLPDGETADAIYLLLNPLYVASRNAFYVRPLDRDYLKTLNNPLTERLYEVLGLRFRGLRSSPYACFDYEGELCPALPITPQKRLDNAQKVLAPHHRKLTATGYLAKVDWRGRQSQRPWEVRYWPGPRAKREMKQAKALPRARTLLLTDNQQRLLDWIIDVCGDRENEAAYRKVVQNYHEGLIETAIGETKQAKREHRIRTTAGAYFMDTLKRLADIHRQAHQSS